MEEIKLEVRLVTRTLSVSVRGVRPLRSYQHGHIADRVGYSRAGRGSLTRSLAIPMGWAKRSVKPSAQPTLVRTQHLPPPVKTAPDQRARL
jgi:hypothetical protein